MLVINGILHISGYKFNWMKLILMNLKLKICSQIIKCMPKIIWFFLQPKGTVMIGCVPTNTIMATIELCGLCVFFLFIFAECTHQKPF